jgi:NTE family protein
MEMWMNLEMNQCLAFSQQRDLKSNDLLSLKNANFLAKELFSQRRLNSQPFRDLLNRYVFEANVRASKVRYGLMTTQVPDFRGKRFWIDQIPEGQLVEYIMASSRLPILEPVVIDGQNFMDGGLVENVPVSMLRREGFRRIITIDLENKPAARNQLDDNTQMIFIHDRQELGGFLDITSAVLQRNLQLGYLDTMKAMGRLNGEYYTFTHPEYQKMLNRFGYENTCGLEQAALIYEMDRCKIYTARDFTDSIKKNRAEIQKLYEQKRQSLNIDNKLSALAGGRLKVLNLLPPLRLAFLIEARANAFSNGYTPKFSIRLFNTVDAAATALSALPEE